LIYGVLLLLVRFVAVFFLLISSVFVYLFVFALSPLSFFPFPRRTCARVSTTDADCEQKRYTNGWTRPHF